MTGPEQVRAPTPRDSAGGVPAPRYPWHTAPAPTSPPPPVGRAAVRGQAAGFVTRALAVTADVVAVLLALAAGYAGVAGFVFLLRPATFSFPAPGYLVILLVAVLTLVAYWTATWAVPGRSYGGQLMGLRVVGPRGSRLHWSHAAARAVLCVLFPLGLLWVLVSPHNRSVQDVVLRTAVVYD
jgi:uncharacterized RDD family membrane protein YckC